MAYLLRLASELLEATKHLNPVLVETEANWTLAAQNDDGGWPGREGKSDLYYTSFALRTLTALERLDEANAARVIGFLETTPAPASLPTVDLFAFLSSVMIAEGVLGELPDTLAEQLGDPVALLHSHIEPLRRDDGGFARTSRGASSTYNTFLLTLLRQLFGDATLGKDLDGIRRFIHTQRRVDGGFCEAKVAKNSGTNPTAAAVTLLQIAGGEVPEGVAEYLISLQVDEGGCKATAKAPVADLLSTMTTLTVLNDLRALPPSFAERAARFARSLHLPEGGFTAGEWDDTPDVEYQFYGLATMTHSQAPRA